ncbi:hypothetical protein SCP_0900040 [Sparassis crispa]|uniref:Uncharacterized protein n=1 Tax=Sparassis crispa TaxID=139825 RepID=A0A401GV62_9APHY|nr:hypothetical protein SCP_0900040 [Sparassis crispa]GBE86127.1 hypothetical protein SCP_0900040 [Sparassis crispa]
MGLLVARWTRNPDTHTQPTEPNGGGPRPPEQNGSDRHTVATSSSTSDREGEAPSLYPLIHARATARGHVIVDVDTVTDTHPPLSALSPLRIPRRHAPWRIRSACPPRGTHGRVEEGSSGGDVAHIEHRSGGPGSDAARLLSPTLAGCR